MPLYRPHKRSLYIKSLHEHEEEEGEEMQDDAICGTCRGSGAGLYGPVEDSRCIDCRGSGVEPRGN
jgi:DnaJ-class molecular chaperone